MAVKLCMLGKLYIKSLSKILQPKCKKQNKCNCTNFRKVYEKINKIKKSSRGKILKYYSHPEKFMDETNKILPSPSFGI